MSIVRHGGRAILSARQVMLLKRCVLSQVGCSRLCFLATRVVYSVTHLVQHMETLPKKIPVPTIPSGALEFDKMPVNFFSFPGETFGNSLCVLFSFIFCRRLVANPRKSIATHASQRCCRHCVCFTLKSFLHPLYIEHVLYVVLLLTKTRAALSQMWR